MTNLVAEFGSATAADQVQSEMRGDRHTRYGRHDRFELPLDHGPALRFYVRNLLVPHSRLEFLCSSVARSSPRTLLSLLRLRDSGDRRNRHVHSLLTKALNHAGVPAPEPSMPVWKRTTMPSRCAWPSAAATWRSSALGSLTVNGSTVLETRAT